MAQRRMFAQTIIGSDAFLDMPLSTQALYFHLSMRADDEGFLNNAKTIIRLVGAKEDDLSVLIAKRFIIPFETGIVVIKHWKIHNYIQKDRLKPTVYDEEKALLTTTKNKGYSLVGHDLDTKRIQDGYKVDTQDSIGKVRLGKVKLGEISVGNKKATPAIDKKPYGEMQNVLLTDEEHEKLRLNFCDHYEDYIEKLSYYIDGQGKDKYKSHYSTIRQWLLKDGVKPYEYIEDAIFDEEGNLLNG